MKKAVKAKKPAVASIDLGNEVGKIERLPVNEAGEEQIRFSVWSEGKMLDRPLCLTEEKLLDLMQAAIQEGILSRDFIGALHSVIEI